MSTSELYGGSKDKRNNQIRSADLHWHSSKKATSMECTYNNGTTSTGSARPLTYHEYKSNLHLIFNFHVTSNIPVDESVSV